MLTEVKADAVFNFQTEIYSKSHVSKMAEMEVRLWMY